MAIQPRRTHTPVKYNHTRHNPFVESHNLATRLWKSSRALMKCVKQKGKATRMRCQREDFKGFAPSTSAVASKLRLPFLRRCCSGAMKAGVPTSSMLVLSQSNSVTFCSNKRNAVLLASKSLFFLKESGKTKVRQFPESFNSCSAQLDKVLRAGSGHD